MAGRRRAELFGSPEDDPDDDPRLHAPTVGTERDVLIGVLRGQRATLELKCSGLGDELALRSVEPSTLSLLGIVRHLADVERRWFRRVLAGHDAPPYFGVGVGVGVGADADADEDFNGAAADRDVIADAWTAWRAEVVFADDFVAAAPDLEVAGVDAWRGEVSLRWVLIHLVEEYARHNGHADLLRERIDGAIGL